MKLFGKGGKLNIIDLLIILILVAAVAFVGVRLLSDKTDTLGSENAVTEPNLRFTVLVADIHPELAAQVEQALAGDPVDIGGNTVERTRLFNSNKLVDAKIIGHEITTAADGTTELRLTVEAADFDPAAAGKALGLDAAVDRELSGGNHLADMDIAAALAGAGGFQAIRAESPATAHAAAGAQLALYGQPASGCKRAGGFDAAAAHAARGLHRAGGLQPSDAMQVARDLDRSTGAQRFAVQRPINL